MRRSRQDKDKESQGANDPGQTIMKPKLIKKLDAEIANYVLNPPLSWAELRERLIKAGWMPHEADEEIKEMQQETESGM